MPGKRAWKAGFLIVTAAGWALAQTGAGRMPGGMKGMGPMGAGVENMPAVTGHPFQATASLVTTWQDDNGGPSAMRQQTMELARDSDGRTYVKTTSGREDGAEPQPVVYIRDAVAHKAYVLFPARQVAMVRSLPAAPAPGAIAGKQGGRHGRATSTETPLEDKMIAGISAKGIKRVTTVAPKAGAPGAAPRTITRTVWTSPDLQVVLEALTETSSGRRVHYLVQSLQTGAPDSSLFQVPSGYTLRPR